MPTTIRTFIALELPAAVISLLDKVQQDLKFLGLRAKWVRSENIHLTLKFLGNIDPGDIDTVGAAISDVSQDFAALTLMVGGIGFFPGLKRPRVVWVGLGGQIQLLLELQRKLADNLAAIGFPKEKRSFKGHLTLGRIKEAVNPNMISRIMTEFADLDSHEFTSGRIILYKSDLKPSGPLYSQLHQVDLGMTNDK